ncbi:hypothetical protein M6B38_284660 [Iris pallida]|uniref:Uncharacterized protein n=1 Tax=Iris pallida TaxID=29817 RepID=A0AAX6I3J8_IRIPA|nr:hypothetical protein M6B38_284660 [Iris pallida]
MQVSKNGKSSMNHRFRYDVGSRLRRRTLISVLDPKVKGPKIGCRFYKTESLRMRNLPIF